MSAREEILALEEQLRLAELGPDPTFFARRLGLAASMSASARRGAKQ
ncbi:MAG TPA: hypothetical protein VER04_08810 [Polyangiaceae bacterium]|nr:hypothetical protein [Polyangiaceae bacterium]